MLSRGAPTTKLEPDCAIQKKHWHQGIRNLPTSFLRRVSRASRHVYVLDFLRPTSNVASQLNAMFDTLHQRPLGPFTHKIIQWLIMKAKSAKRGPNPQVIHLEVDPPTNTPKEGMRIAYIPPHKVQDFIPREDNHIKDVNTTFAHMKRHWKEKGEIKTVEWNVHLLLERDLSRSPFLFVVVRAPFFNSPALIPTSPHFLDGDHIISIAAYGKKCEFGPEDCT